MEGLRSAISENKLSEFVDNFYAGKGLAVPEL
jgi:queuine/archaeosine tRNA-ribosyltransferase